MSDTQQKPLLLPIDHLQPNPLQPRGSQDPEGLADLAASIKIHGILEPLVVAHTPAGYQIIAGERRWRAAKQVGLTEVPVVLRETTPKGMLEMAVIENVQRIDLHVLDRAKAFKRLQDEFGLTIGQIAERVGKSQPYISNSLRLLTLPDALKDGLLSGAITEGHARALANIQNVKLMVEAYKMILKENASVRRAEEIARRMKEDAGQSKSSLARVPALSSRQIEKWQEQLHHAFGERSKVKLSRSTMQTRLVLVFKGSPLETQPLLERVLSLAGDAQQEEDQKG